MIRSSHSVCLLALLWMSSLVWAQTDYELSYHLIRSADGAVLAAQQEDQLRTPASTMKVVTAAAALERLGPGHVYHTRLLTAGTFRKGRLYGNLCLLGDADPELTQNSLARLASSVQALGIRRVDGDLVIDEGPYSHPPYGAGWAWDDAGEDYCPEITGLAVDGGVISLPRGFEAPWLFSSPGEPPYVQLVPGREGVTVQGNLPERLAPPHSSLRTGEFLRAHLQRVGVTVRGRVVLGKADGRELAVWQSRPLQEILEQAMSVSDNLAMELVYRSSAQSLPKVLEGQRLRRVDGSGLSRYNLLSARHLTAVLRSHPELQEICPSGGEGTLKRRFTGGPAQGLVRAKTGTLSNVSALAGYLFPGTEHECVFAIMINGHLDSTADRKAIEDKLVEDWAQRFGATKAPAAIR